MLIRQHALIGKGDQIEFGKVIGGGLTTVDIFVPRYNLIILLDGPCHFVERPISAQQGIDKLSFGDLPDLKDYYKASDRLAAKILRRHHKVVKFDYQAHNIIY